MSILTIEELREAFEKLCQDYKYLSDNREKLQEDCTRLRECIDHQVSQVETLNREFEGIREKCAAHNLDFSRDAQATAPDAQEPAQAGRDEQDTQWEVVPLVPIEQIAKPQNVTLVAEIVDISVICSTAFSPDKTCLAIGSDKTLRVYNIESDAFVLQYTLEGSDETTNHVRSIVWTSDNKKVVFGGEDGRIRMLQVPSGTVLQDFKAGNGEIAQLQITADGQTLAVVMGDAAPTLFKMSDFTKITSLVRANAEPTANATSLSISPDDKMIAVGYQDCSCAIWDMETHQLLCETPCHGKHVYAVKFLPNKNRLVTASLDDTVKIWDIVNEGGKVTMELWKSLEGHTNYVLSLATDPAGEWLLSGSKDLTARLSYLETGEMIYSIKGHTNSVITVAFSPAGDIFCTGSGDQTVKIWSMTPEEAQDISA